MLIAYIGIYFKKLKKYRQQKMEIQERRFSKRLKINLPASFAQLGEERHLGETVTKDISSTGLRMNMNAFFAPDSDFLVKLLFLDRRMTIEGKAKIVWCNRISFPEQYQVGLQFFDLNPLSKKWLQEYILSQESRSE